MSLTASQPYPSPADLPTGYDRFAPKVDEQRPVLASLVAETPWARLGWRELVERLLVLGRTDIPLARLAEGHIDACRILAQAQQTPVAQALYGVWASRSQQTGVAARRTADGLLLDGTLRFASGAGLLDRALVPVWLDDGTHLLVDLEVSGLPVDESSWATQAMTASRTHTVAVEGVGIPGRDVVGPEDFYLGRAAFFPGGVGVAACWAGGAARVTDLLIRAVPAAKPAQSARLGRIRVELAAAAATVRATADLLDRILPEGREAEKSDWHALATECRAVVAAAAERILADTRHATGPAGLALDADLSHAVADLELYVRQQNADADFALLGARLLEPGP